MFLTRRWRFSAAVIAVVALTVGFSWWQYRERLRVRVVAENTTKAQELKSAIDGQFPSGSAESVVVTFLQKAHPGYVRWPAGNWTEYGLPVGNEPSDVWYCGSWTRGVKLRFESGRLVRTAVERWSFDCL